MTPSRPVRMEASDSLGLRDKMSGFGASQLVFPLEVRRGHFEIAHRHVPGRYGRAISSGPESPTPARSISVA